jgi:ATP-binding cassette subfamily F protein uup
MAQPKEKAKSEIDIAVGSQRLGSKIVEFNNISKSYDAQNLIDDFSYFLKRDDRIGIIGANGAGKTTLLEIITERIKPDTGEINVGQTVVIGYYDQESRALNDEQRVIDYVRETAEYINTSGGGQITASQMLDKFLFPPAVQYALVANLSGGERRRLYLLKILMSSPNVLLLDEPTNDLDIPTLMALEEYLDDFPGALIVVSHDRYFLDRTIEHVFKFTGGGVLREYAGDYTAYLETHNREEAGNASGKKAEKASENNTKSNLKETESKVFEKLSFKEKRELETLETEIAAAEKRQIEIEKQLSLSASDAALVHELFSEQQNLNDKLDRDIERWAELSERVDL